MKTSESLTKLATALSKAQASMGAASKSSTNYYQRTYADLSDVIEAVKGPLSENGLSFVQFIGGEPGTLTLTTRLLHDSGEWLESTISTSVPNDIQKLAGAVTYLRRYALQSMVGLPAEDDDGQAMSDQQNRESRQCRERPPEPLSGSQEHEGDDSPTLPHPQLAAAVQEHRLGAKRFVYLARLAAKNETFNPDWSHESTLSALDADSAVICCAILSRAKEEGLELAKMGAKECCEWFVWAAEDHFAGLEADKEVS